MSSLDDHEYDVIVASDACPPPAEEFVLLEAEDAETDAAPGTFDPTGGAAPAVAAGSAPRAAKAGSGPRRFGLMPFEADEPPAVAQKGLCRVFPLLAVALPLVVGLYLFGALGGAASAPSGSDAALEAQLSMLKQQMAAHVDQLSTLRESVAAP